VFLGKVHLIEGVTGFMHDRRDAIDERCFVQSCGDAAVGGWGLEEKGVPRGLVGRN